MPDFTSGCGIDTRDFAKRRSDADSDEGNCDPAPDDVHGTATDKRENERRGQAVWDRGEHRGHEGDLERRSVAQQLRLVPEILEELVGCFGLPHRKPGREML